MCLWDNGYNSVLSKMCWRWSGSAFIVILVFFCCFTNVDSSARFNRIKREALTESLEVYLTNFGYMEKSKDGAFALRTEESVQNSLRELQQFAGIPATGRLDNRTLKLINTPRCGMPDRNFFRTRRKRFSLYGSKWPYTDLTWSVRSRNVDNLSIDDVRFVISKALQVWSKHSRLEFTEVDSDKADILIYFHRGSHGDNFPFDGPGKVLGHAFFPTGTRSSVEVHFDADEKWTTTTDNDDGTNLFNVAAHEMGHSLGLYHSNVESALMYPWYKELEDGYDYELPDDDKQAIQVLYGAPDYRSKWAKNPVYRPAPTTTTTTTTTPRPTRPTQRSKRPYDPRDPNAHYPYPTYPPYYPPKPMNPNKKHLTPHHPDWKKYPKIYQPEVPPTRRYPYRPPETPPPPKKPPPPRTYPPRTYPPRTYPPRTNPPRTYPPKPTQTSTPRTHSTAKPPPDTCNTDYDAISVIRQELFIFKDAYFWRIGDTGLMDGYPALIRRLWHGLPDDLTHVDAVYERNDGRIVFFIDDKYYVFLGNHVESGYPKPLTHLGFSRNVRKIDGATVWGYNGRTYFYSGDSYWAFEEEIQKVELDYPRNISMWKGIGTDIDAVFQWKDGKTYFFKGKGFWQFNDYHMRVQDDDQKLSASTWMGCMTNYEQNKNTKEYQDDQDRHAWEGDKMPLRSAASSASSSLSPSTISSSSFWRTWFSFSLILTLILKI